MPVHQCYGAPSHIVKSTKETKQMQDLVRDIIGAQATGSAAETRPTSRLEKGHFTHILIDEASQGFEAEVMLPLAFAYAASTPYPPSSLSPALPLHLSPHTMPPTPSQPGLYQRGQVGGGRSGRRGGGQLEEALGAQPRRDE